MSRSVANRVFSARSRPTSARNPGGQRAINETPVAVVTKGFRLVIFYRYLIGVGADGADAGKQDKRLDLLLVGFSV
jgi:hypothetical protein